MNKNKLKILIFGGTGRLGAEVLQLSNDQIKILAPSHKECDIIDQSQIYKQIDKHSPDIIINTAAIVGVNECNKDKSSAWKTNVLGPLNITRCCNKKGIKFMLVSTAAVFDGEKGNYKENDIPNPLSYYAVTKLAAEQVALVLPNSIVIRLDLFSKKHQKYNEVFIDHYTSKISTEDAAKKIITIAKSDYKGILHIGRERESLFKILKPIHPEIEPIKIGDSSMPNFPKDISLDLSRWKKYFENGS